MCRPDGPLFVRQSRGGDWDSVSESTAEDLNFPADVLADVVDTDCQISIWEVSGLDAPEVDFLVPALVPRSATGFSQITFRFISDWKLETIGLKGKKRQAVGGCLDHSLNRQAMHWHLEIQTIRDAIVFAKALTARPPRIYSKEEVMQRFAISLQAKRLQTKNFNHTLYSHLVDANYLSYTELAT